jgi:hypothetical protein
MEKRGESMIYIYMGIVLLSMLSGCSWWKQAELPTREPQSVRIAENPRLHDSTACESESVRIQEADESIDTTADYKEKLAEVMPAQEPVEKKTDQKQKTKITRREFKQKRSKKKAVKKTSVSPEKSMTDMVAPSSTRPVGFCTDTSIRTKTPTTEILPQPASNMRTITVQHAMDIPMLTVKHWTGTYVPTKLTVTINDQLIPIIEDSLLVQPTPYAISVSDNRFVMHYYYEFMNGMRKEENSFTYCLADAATTMHMSFDWTTPSHVVFDHANLC